MKCEICGKEPQKDGITLWRVNEKGVKGIWRYEDCLTKEQKSSRDEELVRLENILSGKDKL